MSMRRLIKILLSLSSAPREGRSADEQEWTRSEQDWLDAFLWKRESRWPDRHRP
jgi:hypothetical protein